MISCFFSYYLFKLSSNDQYFDHRVMEHVEGHGILAQELTQPAGAHSGQEGLAIILGQAQDHHKLEMAEEQLAVHIDVGKLSR